MAGHRDNPAPDLAYGHESHRALNEHLTTRSAARSVSGRVAGPWLSNEALARLPQARREFDLNRDPYGRAQVLDMEGRGPKQRDQSGRGSGMVGRDKPQPVFRPPKEISRPVDRGAFRSNWLAEQREAAWARATPSQGRSNDTPALSRRSKEPSR